MTDQTNTQAEDEKKAAAKAAAEAKAAEKQAAKEAKKAAAEEAKAAKAVEAAAKKEAKDAELAAKKAEKEAAKGNKGAEKEAKKAELAAKKQAKIDAAESAKAAKEAAKAPEQNGVRQRSPDTNGGRVWALCNSLSEALGQPTPVKDVLEAGLAQDMNAANVRCEYSAWKKFHGIEGRVSKPAMAGADA